MSGRLVLVRHGQSFANVDRRLDTRPPGSELTPLGRDQARAFARDRRRGPGCCCIRWPSARHRPRRRSAPRSTCRPARSIGIHEVQVGDLENRNDDDAVAEFDAVYRRWHEGERDVPMPGGETANQVLDRYLPVLTDLRTRYLDDDDWTSDIVVVSHGAAIRLTAAVLAGVESSFVLDHHLANTEAVVLTPVTDGRWSCVQWGTLTPPFYPAPDAAPVVDAVESGADPMG